MAEQSFNVLNAYKYTTRKMSYCKRLLFFKFIDDNANSLKFKCLNVNDSGVKKS